MKNIFLIAFTFISIQFASAQELTWHTDINKAIEISKKEKKPMMLFFTGSDWCGWCIKLQKEVFFKPEFTEWSKKVILVELDFPRKKQLEANLQAQNNTLQQIFQVQGFPTIWFVNPQVNGEKINLEQIGKSGYVAGGAKTWIQSADMILGNKTN
jgi:protein disulfide-isomerase